MIFPPILKNRIKYSYQLLPKYTPHRSVGNWPTAVLPAARVAAAVSSSNPKFGKKLEYLEILTNFILSFHKLLNTSETSYKY